MSNNIGWTDRTANPLVGCTPASSGCANCWAATDTWIRQHNPKSPHYQAGLTKASGVWSGEIVFRPEVLEQIRNIKQPQRIFMPSMSDPFHPDVKEEWLEEIFGCIYDCPHITFQLLTKRPERMVDSVVKLPYWDRPKNLWLGVSVENQQTANERIPHLLELADVEEYTTFVSAEPLLGEIDLVEAGAIEKWAQGVEEFEGYEYEAFVDWVIVGGESGAKARPCNINWIRSLVEQCHQAGIPTYVKQLGSNPVFSQVDYPTHYPCFHVSGKGADIDEFPYDLRIREFPSNAAGQEVEW